MKKCIHWLLAALLFVCAKLSAQTVINLSLNSSKPQYVVRPAVTAKQSPEQVSAPTTTQKAKTPPNHMTTKGSKVGEGTDFLEKFFAAEREKNKVDSNAFSISVDTTVNYDLIKAENERWRSAKTAKGTNTIVAPIDSFNKIIASQKMTVKYENGQFIAVNPQSEGKQLAEKSFGIEIEDDEPDSIIFNNGKGIFWRGEYFQKASDDEIEKHYAQPKKAKKKREPSYVRITERVPNTVEEFLDEYEDDIRLAAQQAGIPYAVKCGQILTEASLRGKMSSMAKSINNLGGVKCGGGRCTLGDGHHGYFTDDRENETFRKYATPSEFLKEHNRFLQENDRYNRCFECGNDVDCWLYRLKKSGYASHKGYDYLIASVINHYRLTDRPLKYDRKQTAKRLNIKF